MGRHPRRASDRGEEGPDGIRVIDTLDIGCDLGCATPAMDGGWVLAAGLGFARLAVDGALTWLSRPEQGNPIDMRMNDRACDPRGRFWAGSKALDDTPQAGSLYRLDPDGSTHTMVTGLTIRNGIAWNPNGQTMWLVDSAARVIDVFDFDLDAGAIANRRTVIRLDPDDGQPDGLTVDEEGCIWVAIWDGAEVRRYAPDGRLLGAVKLPVARPTSCCFGSADLATLFVTSARTGLSQAELGAQPSAGCLFRIDPGVRGLPLTRFGEQR